MINLNPHQRDRRIIYPNIIEITKEKSSSGKNACHGFMPCTPGVAPGDVLNDSVSIEIGARPEPNVATAKQNSIIQVNVINL